MHFDLGFMEICARDLGLISCARVLVLELIYMIVLSLVYWYSPPSALLVKVLLVYGSSLSSALVIGLFLSLGFHPSWLISIQELGFPNAGLFSLYCKIRVCVGFVQFSCYLL